MSWFYFVFRRRARGVRVSRVKMVVGSGMFASGKFRAFLRKKRSARFEMLSWLASPRAEVVPKFWVRISRSWRSRIPSSFRSPSIGAAVVVRLMALPEPPAYVRRRARSPTYWMIWFSLMFENWPSRLPLIAKRRKVSFSWRLSRLSVRMLMSAFVWMVRSPEIWMGASVFVFAVRFSVMVERSLDWRSIFSVRIAFGVASVSVVFFW